MRIAMLAPLDMRVPPPGYGGTELIVSLLTEEMHLRGHKVTLFASGDSQTEADLQSVWPTFLRGTDHDTGVFNRLNALACLERADDFDIVHNHLGLEAMSMASLVKTPMLTTLHGPIGGDWLRIFRHYPGWYNTISRSAQSALPPCHQGRFAGVIYNAIDTTSHPFNPGPREPYLLYLSRVSPEKGTHLAIELAEMTGQRLIIAGNVDKVDEEYFQKQVLPGVDGDQIQFVGEVFAQEKRHLLAQARCLVAPITWEEPFGLFLIEAMACGTPVVAFRRGAAPEVIEEGTTGYLVDTLEEMAGALEKVDRIEPTACREHVERHFGVARMGDDYMSAYHRIIFVSRNGVRSAA